jgi:crotonobetainyl-CoA:carnitine CoA-transferase CaiB-like acyl-CoA transferase
VRYEAPPLLGSHTDEVLQSLLGMSAEQVAALRSGEVI